MECNHTNNAETLAASDEVDATYGSHFYLCADCGDAIFVIWLGGETAAYSLDYENMARILLEMGAIRRKLAQGVTE